METEPSSGNEGAKSNSSKKIGKNKKQKQGPGRNNFQPLRQLGPKKNEYEHARQTLHGEGKFVEKGSTLVDPSVAYVWELGEATGASGKKKNKKRKNKNMEMEKKINDVENVVPAEESFEEEKEGPEGVHKKSECQDVKIPPPNLNPVQLLLLRENCIYPLTKQLAKNPRALFECRVCQYHCDNQFVVENHMQEKRHLATLQARFDRTTVSKLPPYTMQQTQAINNLVCDVAVKYGLGLNELSSRKKITECLNECVKKHLPGCTIRMYGSSASGIALKHCDLDMQLVVPSDLHAPKMLIAFADLMASQNTQYGSVCREFNASIPSVLFVDLNEKVTCRISLGDDNTFYTSKLLAAYAAVDGRVRVLGIMFRKWAEDCKIVGADRGMWPAYAFSIMLVYFLQQLPDPVLPVLQSLVEHPNPTKPHVFLDPTECAIEWKTCNKMSVGELWLRLLKFYVVDFEATQNIVCITQHAPLTRLDKKWSGKKLAIEDPFNPKLNVSRTVANLVCFDYATNCFQNTYKYFGILQSSRGPIFMRIRELPQPEEDHTLEQNFNLYIPDNVFQDFLENSPMYTNNGASVNMTYLDHVTPTVMQEQAALMYHRFNYKYLKYMYVPATFIGNQTVPEFCTSCQKEGHLSDSCKEESLYPFRNSLPPMDAYYMEAINTFCAQVAEKWAPNDEEIAERKKFVADLESFVKQSLPEAKLELFGSSCNGFGLHKSDMDICLTFKNNPTGKGLPLPKIIKDLMDKLRKFDKINHLLPITTAKVPIIKFHHPATELDGDISIYNTLAQRNTRLLRAYASIDPRVQVLGFVLKRFAKVCNICDASQGSLSSYAYILMLIYFLQQCEPPVLPVLQQIQKPEEPNELVEGCDTYFYEDIDSLPDVWPSYGKNTLSVGDLWCQFLEFYTVQFNFQMHVVSIRQKELLLRFEKLWTDKCMAIEDPFSIGHNLGVGLSKRMHVYVVKAFRAAYQHFGTPTRACDAYAKQYEEFFLNPKCLTSGEPPNDRGCHICRRIGHVVKDCPVKQQARNKKRPERKGNIVNNQPVEEFPYRWQRRAEPRVMHLPAPQARPAHVGQYGEVGMNYHVRNPTGHINYRSNLSRPVGYQAQVSPAEPGVRRVFQWNSNYNTQCPPPVNGVHWRGRANVYGPALSGPPGRRGKTIPQAADPRQPSSSPARPCLLVNTQTNASLPSSAPPGIMHQRPPVAFGLRLPPFKARSKPAEEQLNNSAVRNVGIDMRWENGSDSHEQHMQRCLDMAKNLNLVDDQKQNLQRLIPSDSALRGIVSDIRRPVVEIKSSNQ